MVIYQGNCQIEFGVEGKANYQNVLDTESLIYC